MDSHAGDANADLSAMPDPLRIAPLREAPDAVVAVPGSKSLTNRALVCAALATGTSRVRGALMSDDTEAMMRCLQDLGIRISVDRTGTVDGSGPVVTVEGSAGRPGPSGAVLDAGLSGTTSRFIAPMAVLGHGNVVLDGSEPLRRRPMVDLFEALELLGAGVVSLGRAGHLPVQLIGDPSGLRGGELTVAGDVSSQFLSALLLSAPAMGDGLIVRVSTDLVSTPYVAMTVAVMRQFGASVFAEADWRQVRVEPGGYRACEYLVEPDASAASYFFALAAVTGGRIRVEGLSRSSLQGDVAFVDVLDAMGAEVNREGDAIEVRGTGVLHGVTVDMAAISDTAQTLAAIAPLADCATTVTGIGFNRGKETDRIAAVVRELRRLGIDASEDDDGFSISPGRPRPGVVRTYDDHRMAMSFAVLGLAIDGVSIADPGCVSKTFPTFWNTVEQLRSGGAASVQAT